MNYEKACKILDISENHDDKTLKKGYYLKALQNHPDKNNNTEESKMNFQEILDAYNFLNMCSTTNTTNTTNTTSTTNTTNTTNKNAKYTYFDILEKFMHYMVNNKMDASKLINLLNIQANEISIELFKCFTRDTLIKLEQFLTKYSEILYVKNDIIIKIKILLKEYLKNDKIIIINPSLHNLLNDDVYQLEYDGEIYYTPLWHHELVYTINSSNNILIVQCEPSLPEFMSIDEYNNLYINISTTLKSLLKHKVINITFDSNNDIISNKMSNRIDKLMIPIEELYIKREQRYILHNKGIYGIDTTNTADIYNTNKLRRSDIYIDICFTDCK